jgi:DNA-directed RNA polymerase subunit RPC12/RpoP
MMIQNCAKCMANLWRWNRKAHAYECKNCGHLDR